MKVDEVDKSNPEITEHARADEVFDGSNAEDGFEVKGLCHLLKGMAGVLKGGD